MLCRPETQLQAIVATLYPHGKALLPEQVQYLCPVSRKTTTDGWYFQNCRFLLYRFNILYNTIGGCSVEKASHRVNKPVELIPLLLKTINLIGFKGFAEPTELSIEGGLSGIIGPNGCGKSNLVEAIGWVMGEHRPRAVRGNSMTDVIFAGVATRPAQSYAEVSLEIQLPARHSANGRMAGRDLQVTRRVDHSLGSVFRINGKVVRRKDVQLLFADGGQGSRFSAYVRQGNVGDIVNARPRDRSVLLEEAAGVGGLFLRRHDAERKLDATSANLERVEHGITQLQNQCKSLRRQANLARQFRTVASELRNLERQLAFAAWNQAVAASDQASNDYQRGRVDLKEARQRAALATRKRQECGRVLEPLRILVSDLKATQLRLESERQRAEDQVGSVRNRLFNLTAQIIQIDGDICRERELEQDAECRCAELQIQIREWQSQNTQHDAEVERATKQVAASATRLKDADRELEHVSEKYARFASNREFVEQTLKRARQEIDLCERLEVETLKSIETLQRQRNSVSDDRALLEANQKQAATAVAAAEDWVQSEQEHYRKLQDAAARANANRIAENTKLRSIDEELRSLDKLLFSTGNDQVRHWDRLQVDQGYEAAVGSALGDDLFFNVASQQNISGWRSLPALSKPTMPSDQIEPIVTYVTAPQHLRRRLAQVWLADETTARQLQTALQPGQRIVTIQGDCYRWDGLVVLSQDASNSATLRLMQSNRRKELRAERQHVQDCQEQASQRCAEVGKLLESASTKVQEARKGRTNAQSTLRSIRRGLAKTSLGLEHLQTQLAVQKEKLQRILTDKDVTAGQLADAKQAAQQLGEDDDARNSLKIAKGRVATAHTKYNALHASRLHLIEERTARNRRIAESQSQLESWQDRHGRATNRIAELVSRKALLRREQADLEDLPGQLEKTVGRLARLIRSDAKKLQVEQKNLSIADKRLHEAEAGEEIVLQAFNLATERSARLQALHESSRHATRAELARIENDFQCKPHELLQGMALPPKAAAHSQLQGLVNELRRKKASLGPVNLLAEDELNEVEADLAGLQLEKSEIEAAVDKLRRSITTLNSEGQDRLKHAFSSVNRNFRKLFSELFGGGDAWLELVESDDPLKSGFEIHCRLPGKHQTVLSLMSGGEQALTGLALIFSFFLSNPAPLCILDEADAPLDDANTVRLCDMLDRIVRKLSTKFLIITHNPITMNRMDRLYGITMQEQGVSQLVSVDLANA